MASRPVAITQAKAKCLFKAGLDVGFCAVKVIFHPDGRIEAMGTLKDTTLDPAAENSWDEVLS